MRILIVDKEPLIADALRGLLAEEHECTLAADAGIAIELLESGTPDVVLLDVDRAGSEADKVRRWIEAQGERALRRVVFMSTCPPDLGACRGMDVPTRTLVKPFSHAELMSALCATANTDRPFVAGLN